MIVVLWLLAEYRTLKLIVSHCLWRVDRPEKEGFSDKETPTLTAELLAFKVSISLKGHDSYGNDAGMWRENPHDDLVLAVALAAWYGEKYKPPSLSFRGSRYSGRR